MHGKTTHESRELKQARSHIPTSMLTCSEAEANGHYSLIRTLFYHLVRILSTPFYNSQEKTKSLHFFSLTYSVICDKIMLRFMSNYAKGGNKKWISRSNF